ncbi:hypothetical protein BKA61DRAFT_674624 [Leptodontidium sp. MPI-SDFR-AT-0119]|nr:hypothetical protein BKA61DRAFT_674624 [Leptodontidium sp. MPI-SDFR-AT-0119]
MSNASFPLSQQQIEQCPWFVPAAFEASGCFGETLYLSKCWLLNVYRELGVVAPVLREDFKAKAAHDRICGICKQPLAENLHNGEFGYPVALLCGHVFERRCIELGIEAATLLRCPICEDPLGRMSQRICYMLNAEAILHGRFHEVIENPPRQEAPQDRLGIQEPRPQAHTNTRVQRYRNLGIIKPALPSQCHSIVCTLCTDRYESPNKDGLIEYPVILPCGDTFGRGCLEEAIGTRPGFRCPTCRNAISQMFLESCELREYRQRKTSTLTSASHPHAQRSIPFDVSSEIIAGAHAMVPVSPLEVTNFGFDVSAPGSAGPQGPFVNSFVSPTGVTRKQYGPRSRNGCYTCKNRRVKCDEGRPVCRDCHRIGYTCTYPVQAQTSRSRNGMPALAAASTTATSTTATSTTA